ncbi:MAG: 16S rRNA (guanine(527)-N(7))-methyltransferase RsmG [Bacteroidetes bacterium]|nr:MAG: 16S rRNA (guanine(527)-N(7))-methyltransferase RsmG [Bacteroidota bacterium]
MKIIQKYFPELTKLQESQLGMLQSLYEDWNGKINVISRKDIEQLYERHVLHSLGIAKFIQFVPGTSVLDVGTGGGFPGIPLAIMFPETHFHLVDSIGKKIKVVEAVSSELKLNNVTSEKARAEDLAGSFDFVVSRAVTSLPGFYGWMRTKIKKQNKNPIKNGIIYLKGGDFEDELKGFKNRSKVFPLSSFFEEPFFETKKIVHIF